MLRCGHRLCLLLGLIWAMPAFAQDIRFFNIATGGVAGTYYPIGGLIANVISQPPGARSCARGGSCGVPNLVAIARSSDGSVANIRGLAAGNVDSVLAQSDVAQAAMEGLGAFAEMGAFKDLRLIASLYLEHAQIVTIDAPTIADLAGKRLSVDSDGSGTQRVARLLLKAYDLGADDLDTQPVRPSQAIQMMRNGELDGLIIMAGVPTKLVAEAIEDLDAQLVPLDQLVMQGLIEQNPFLSIDEIPAETYRGQTQAVPTLAVVAQWLTSADQDEELIYQITQSLWHPTSRILLDNGHFRGQSLTLETALDGAAVPLHPGAERFYKEAGLISE